MTFEQFKDAAKNTGYCFNNFFETEFVRPTALNLGQNCVVFVAEIMSSKKHISLYFPNDQGGATLVKGFGKDREILFFDSVEEIRA